MVCHSREFRTRTSAPYFGFRLVQMMIVSRETIEKRCSLCENGFKNHDKKVAFGLRYIMFHVKQCLLFYKTMV